MRLTVIGCSGSFAGPTSPSSSYLVQAEADGRTWNVLLDLGSGALGPLQQHLSPYELDAVLLTHLHPDHCVDMCGLYVMRRYNPSGRLPGRLPVHGPEGTAERVLRPARVPMANHQAGGRFRQLRPRCLRKARIRA